MRTAALPGGSQSEPLLTRAFEIDKGELLGSYTVEDSARALQGMAGDVQPRF
jgi:hypothetical protein